MQFKKIEELKPGMRLARPIYNKNGVLLFERDSKISAQGISNIANFGLIGLFILEPAEPCPPMSQDDVEFERFQTVNVFSLMDEIDKIKTKGKSIKLQIIVSNVIKNYGHLDNKINFNQNLRSEEDASFKHALNVAILSAMISNRINIKVEERLDIATAALICGNLNIDLIEKEFSSNPNVKRYIVQSSVILDGFEKGEVDKSVKLMDGGKVLAVARFFDDMTAMRVGSEPESEVATIKMMLDKPDVFDRKVVMGLVDSINILVPGVCVELNTGTKALVLNENRQDFFRPMILSFDGNEVMDLANKSVYGDLEIKDIMKTMDNRHVVDTETLKSMGLM